MNKIKKSFPVAVVAAATVAAPLAKFKSALRESAV